MSAAYYVVRPGDTLARIARAHGTSTSKLVEINRIGNPDRIDVGQKLRLPGSLPRIQVSGESQSDEDVWGSLVLQFVDAICRPINALKVRLEAQGKIFESTTNDRGIVEPVAVKNGESIKVHVERAQGGLKHVTTLTSDGTAQHARIRSPKIAVTASLRRHEGPPGPPPTHQRQRPGTERSVRSSAGNPVHEIALECPNPENLRLSANFKYRDIVIAAAKRVGLVPPAVAAIMNAEASSVPKRYIVRPAIDFETGKPRVGKGCKPIVDRIVDPTWTPGEWDPYSKNPRSSARGMTQVLDATWIDLACTEGTYLSAKARKEGWLVTAPVQTVRQGKTTVRTAKAFKLSSGAFVTGTRTLSLSRVLSRKPYKVGEAKASDPNLQALLDLRFSPEYAIHTAVDYGMVNLAALRQVGYRLDGLNDADLAKVIYLCHHLGADDAMRFIDNRINAKRAQYLLEQQLGVDGARSKAMDHGGDYLAAHRNWLNAFVNNMIDINGFYCMHQTSYKARSLFAVCESIKKRGQRNARTDA